MFCTRLGVKALPVITHLGPKTIPLGETVVSTGLTEVITSVVCGEDIACKEDQLNYGKVNYYWGSVYFL